MNPSGRPILLLEINEIPWRLLDHYLAREGFPNLRRFMAGSQTYTTVAVDSGELSPWVTWPTLHRGMRNDDHGILNLGQDPMTFKGVPIWEEFRGHGRSIGICGSMQSWPPSDPGEGGFYIPDTFAHDARCIPAYIEPIQRFNLNQVRRNGRVVRRQSVFNLETLGLLFSLPKLGIGLATLRETAKQLVGERLDRTKVARRPVFQSMLFWDIFKARFHAENPPAFATFFTNHIAGLMHRYWSHVFPQDFGDKYAATPKVHSATMDYGMLFLDRILGDALAFRERNPDLILVFATSMGQAAVHRDGHEGFAASIPEVGTLMSLIGLRAEEYKSLLAMVPQVAVEIPDGSSRARVRDFLEACIGQGGSPLFSVQENGGTLSITFKTPKLADIRAGGFHAPSSEKGRMRRVTWDEAGVVMNETEAGTAYHIPEGILAVCGSDPETSDARTRIPADQVKGMLMALGGLASSEKSPGLSLHFV